MDNPKIAILEFRQYKNMLFAIYSQDDKRKKALVKCNEEKLYIQYKINKDADFQFYNFSYVDKLAYEHFIVHGTNIPKKGEYRPFYDMEQILSIPLEEILYLYSIPVVKRNGSLWCSIRNERTPSCKIYTNTNSFCDYGNCYKGGNAINLVCYITGCDNETARNTLAKAFGIQPINNVKRSKEVYELTNLQYSKINIQADLATKNFDFQTEAYSTEKNIEFSEKYRMSVQQLSKEYPVVYENMLKHRALPFVYEMKNNYIRACYNQDNFYKMLGNDILLKKDNYLELEAMAKELTTTEKIMQQACHGTNIKYKSNTYEAEQSIKGVRNGEISFEIGTIRYIDLKLISKSNNQAIGYKEVPLDLYSESLMECPHSAFVKGSSVNIAFEKNKELDICEALNKNKQKIR